MQFPYRLQVILSSTVKRSFQELDRYYPYPAQVNIYLLPKFQADIHCTFIHARVLWQYSQYLVKSSIIFPFFIEVHYEYSLAKMVLKCVVGIVCRLF